MSSCLNYSLTMTPQVLIDDQRLREWQLRHRLSRKELLQMRSFVTEHVLAEANPLAFFRDTLLGSTGWCSQGLAAISITRDDGSTFDCSLAYHRLDLTSGDPILIRLNFARP